jgi:hypothetical protein
MDGISGLADKEIYRNIMSTYVMFLGLASSPKPQTTKPFNNPVQCHNTTTYLHKDETSKDSRAANILRQTMAKSIRSKAKRKNRTEFRKTIGTVRVQLDHEVKMMII